MCLCVVFFVCSCFVFFCFVFFYSLFFISLCKRLKPPYGSFLALVALASSASILAAASGKASFASVSAATQRVPIALMSAARLMQMML